MKVEITTKISDDYEHRLLIVVDDKPMPNFCDGKLEDNNLNRSLSDCFNIESVVQMAYEAGKTNEKLEISGSAIERCNGFLNYLEKLKDALKRKVS